MQPTDRTSRQTVAGLFHDRTAAEQAIHALKAAGFAADRIGVAMRDRTAQGVLIEDTGASAAASATTGALGGGLLGGLLGFLVGAGALAIPGIGPIVAGGVLASTFGVAGGTALAGAGIGAAAGGMVGALVGMGIPEDEARHFETGLRAGGTLVTVGADGRASEARAILERHGADTGPEADGAASSPDDKLVQPGRLAGARPAPGAPDTGTPEVVGGMVSGAAAGAVAGTVVAGPVGTVVGGALGAAAGATAGEGVHEARPADHDDKAVEGGSAGALAGGAAGAAVGSVVAGPLGTAAGAAVGGVLGAAAGAAAGAKVDDDDADEDERARRK